MTKLPLSIAVGDYDRTRPLSDGSVQIDGISPILIHLSPEEIFFRAFRHTAFDICELSLSSFTVKIAGGDCPYVGVPVFPSRAFRHTSIHVRTDSIKHPEDLKGKTVGVPEYQLTANVWARGLLEDEFGVKPADINWVRGGLEQPGRLEKIPITLPEGVRLSDIRPGKTLSTMLADGEIDGIIAPRMPSCFDWGHPNVGWLFADPAAEAAAYFARTGVFPIMHLIGIRRTLVEQHPWLPVSVFKAFEQARRIAVSRLADTSATKVTMPFVEEQLRRVTELMGPDYWSYGIEGNRKTLETFLRYHYGQGLSARCVPIEALFHPSTFESFKV